MTNADESWFTLAHIIYTLISICGFIGLCMWIFPVYGVWAAHKRGLADLAQAQNEQQVQVAEAQGRLMAAKSNKEAAIIEAEAVAAQIERIGKQLTAHDLYLKWQWIKMMEERPENSTIYVPTEASLPILEAGLRNRSTRKAKEEAEE